MQAISIREFNNNISSYLEEAFAGEEIRVTKRGKTYITLSRTLDNVATITNKKRVNVATREVNYPKTANEVATMLPKREYLQYGCGCPKGVGSLCSKHGRA